MTDAVLPEHLAPAAFVDSGAPEVRAFADRAAGTATDPVEVAARLFAAVRDGGDGSRYMEYVHDRGVFTDLPFDLLRRTFDEVYGPGRMLGTHREHELDAFTR